MNPSSATPSDRPWVTPDQAAEAIVTGDGSGVRIAVIDSGVDVDHPRLAGLEVIESIAMVEEHGQIRAVDGEGVDIFGHGTAVAGIIHELAPKAQIGSFRVLDARSLSRTEMICRGVALAIEKGYDILNCSFGCKGRARFILPHKEWSDAAYLAGIHVVAACSNAGAEEPDWPSHFNSVIGVTMANEAAEGVYYLPRTQVPFAARGENVAVPWMNGQMREQTGSSFAAPQVTALLARLLSVFPGLPPALVNDLLPRIVKPWNPRLSVD